MWWLLIRKYCHLTILGGATGSASEEIPAVNTEVEVVQSTQSCEPSTSYCPGE